MNVCVDKEHKQSMYFCINFFFLFFVNKPRIFHDT